jgi:hypothetical protein
MENIKKYSTKDFYISCVLLASKKLILKSLEKTNGKLVLFIFEDPNSLAEKIIQDHWNRKNRIPSRDLIEAINELKTRIHSGV